MTTRISARPLLLALLLSGSAMAVSGCIPLILGGAYVGGSTAVDRRSAGTQVEDSNIQLKIVGRLSGRYDDKATHVNTEVYNHKVLLTGQVPTEAVKRDAENVARGVDNVRQVVNELQVGMLPTSVATRSNDVLIEGKIKASLIDAKDLSSSAFDVVVENGVAYVMGRVTEREGARGAAIIAGVSGVTKVVTAYDYLTEAQLQNLSTGAASQPRTVPITEAQPASPAPTAPPADTGAATSIPIK